LLKVKCLLRIGLTKLSGKIKTTNGN
jgi:hypothetical protein